MSDQRKLLDLSLEITNGMPAHRLFPSPIFIPFITHEDAVKDELGTPDDPFTYAVNYLTTHEHLATHLDAPRHIDPNGATVDELDLSLFSGPAVCLDLQHVPDLGIITAADLDAAEEKAGVKVDGQIVLLCTGFHKRHWPEGGEPDDGITSTNPGLDYEASKWLADRGSKVHGVEGPSTDKAGDPQFPNHRACRDFGMVHYEWLINLEQLLGIGEFQFVGYPLKLVTGTGSPVRAVAYLPE
jgi:kynurenine formamidase